MSFLLVWFWFVVFAIRYPFPEIRDEVPENFKATADNTDGLWKIGATKHTYDANEEEPRPRISSLWLVS